jgi:hypothetical protein
MGWKWNPSNETIHIYYKVIWEHKYMKEYQKIFQNFLSPFYKFILCTPTSCMTKKEINVIKRIGYWYLMDHGTYIIVYGAKNSPLYSLGLYQTN